PLVPLDVGAEALADELGAGAVEIVIGGPSPLLGLASGGGPGVSEAQVRVSSATHPFLDSHRVRDVPVVPVVLVLEWFTRAAEALYPGVMIKQCKDLKVLKGIQLTGFENGGSALTVRWTASGTPEAPQLDMELVGEGEIRHYSASLEMALTAEDQPAPIDASSLKLQPWKWSPKDVYGEHLFHGGDFAVIRSLDGVSDTAGTAHVAGTREMGWQGDTWRTDAAALDGGLQLAILWGEHVLGQLSLPTKVGSYQAYTDVLTDGPITAVLKGRAEGTQRTVSDIAFVDDQGRLLAEMRDVEMHMLPKS
ncbi:MAG: polyketide synthase dehydratase domain-containing protein, partial [Myxococcota bacterium]|nr:polyketide synthase dehydratase domain-containing protein [Myxococcota bacterium]